MLPDHNGYSEDYLENTELNRGSFLSFSSADLYLLAPSARHSSEQYLDLCDAVEVNSFPQI